MSYDYRGFFENEVKMRKAALFPPYSLICRVMVVADEDGAAIEALKTAYFAVEELRAANSDEFIFLNKMHSPIKKIQGKVRYQVLMRLRTDRLLPRIYDIAAGASSPAVLVYVEENPVNLS